MKKLLLGLLLLLPVKVWATVATTVDVSNAWMTATAISTNLAQKLTPSQSNIVQNIAGGVGSTVGPTVFDFNAPDLTNMDGGWKLHIGHYATNYVATNGNDATAVRNDPTHPWKDPYNAQFQATNFMVVKLGEGWFTNSITPESPNVAFIGSGIDKTFIQATNLINSQEQQNIGVTMSLADNQYYAHLTIYSTSNSAGQPGSGQAIRCLGDDNSTATNVVFNNAGIVGFQDGMYMDSAGSFDMYNCYITNYYDAVFTPTPQPQKWRFFNTRIGGVYSAAFNTPRLSAITITSGTSVEFWGGSVDEHAPGSVSQIYGLALNTNSFVYGTVLSISPPIAGIQSVGGAGGYWNADGTNYARYYGVSPIKSLYAGYFFGDGENLINIASPSSISSKPVAVTVGASVFGYTNVTSDTLQVWITGGTGSFTVNGSAVGGLLTGNENFPLAPTNQIKITYTVAPTMFTNRFQTQTR